MDADFTIGALALAAISGVLGIFIGHYLSLRTQQKNDKLKLLKQLVGTWLLEAHPDYQLGIALVPVTFDSDADVLRARDVYLAHVSQNVPEDISAREKHLEKTRDLQAHLISLMAKSVGLPIDQDSLKRSRYVAQGYVDRERLSIDAASAQVRIAAAVEENNSLLRSMIADRNP